MISYEKEEVIEQKQNELKTQPNLACDNEFKRKLFTIRFWPLVR